MRLPTPCSARAALGDIGRHFPDTDPAYRDADSRRLLREAAARVRAAGYTVVNVDATIIAQAPTHGAAHPGDGRKHRG